MSAVTTPKDRRIKFLSRDYKFPQDPTFREYRVIEDLTGVSASDIMTGTAGIWMLPVLAIVAVMRNDKSWTREKLDRILDLDPSQITVTGLTDDEEDEDPNPPAEVVKPRSKKSTGTKSTDETPSPSGTQDSLTTSPEQPESPTT